MNVLEVDDLKKHYPIHGGMLRREVGRVRAVDGVSFSIAAGETLALVGESGCGKTTVSRCILRALTPTSGAIRFDAGDGTVDLATMPKRAMRPLRRHIQMIFQDPYSSLNPRMMVGDIIAEPLKVNGVPAAERNARVLELLDLVQMPAVARTRFPHAFSGGQRQRIGIARALALNPRLVVADEPVSALDVSVQAQIINLLLDLQDRLKLSMLFVAHDLSVVRHVSDRVAVMYVGRIVEIAPTDELYRSPRHPYTETLLAAVPAPDPLRRGRQMKASGEVADPAKPPPGCAFHPRCPYVQDRCRTDRPELAEVAPGRWTSCHRAREIELAGVA
ncbi:ATP-binding cassette domain-containing protein [Roseomonas terrae]|jgi:oligopeptide/dipeptide ABC transporter ATP-binding protein|uniref:ATP-binding cassette domain-containing protein n=1 Tax=Neoroseomonas terrae TaxID=424799 RepID=A0ABS5EAQ8_9PROT|nr:oligopeptide/dipeptide ABC transporter ATP-binding protein [Neoroseomonas terrae]MBR0648106.1 ATP-binding cassette domain-containing protein [Neoroseomonas terrae]